LNELKKEYEAKNMQNLEPSMEKLNQVFQAASQDMYNAANAGGNPNPGAESNAGSSNSEDEVTDVDFEEVNDKK
ncbi:MAG: molecular chaperone DnaK, partial [Flavobacteriia bacterium]|nr:molecular chaperone DnaK [Flavobacteriia bacterium]